MNCTRYLFALVLLAFSLTTFSLLSWTQTTEGAQIPHPPSPWGSVRHYPCLCLPLRR
jgi:hypothetical protein